jgi:hypothetical protein
LPEAIRDENTGHTLHINKDGSINLGGAYGKLLVDDFTTSDVTYIGKSYVGASVSSSIWQIMVIDETGSTTQVGLYPNADQNYVYKWSLRDTYSYS